MKFISISDIHIKSSSDPFYQSLLKLLDTCLEQKLNCIYLLGDIFDLMVSSANEYEQEYQEFFEKIEQLSNKKIKVYFVEGNHDFHIQVLFEKYGAIYTKKSFRHKYNGLNFYFCHGDEFQLKNSSYKIYKKIINNSFINFLVNKIIPFTLTDKLGKKFSRQSKKKNIERYSSNNNKFTFDLFRESAQYFFKKNPEVSVVICGHSHVLDLMNDCNKTYINNGFVKIEKKYIYFDGNNFKFEELSKLSPSHE